MSREAAAHAIERSRSAIFEGDHAAAMGQVQQLQGRISQSYLPFADVIGHWSASEAETTGERTIFDEFSRTLHLHTAEHVSRYLVDGRAVRMSTIVSAPDGVLQMTIDSEIPLDLSVDVQTTHRVLSRSATGTLASIGMLLPSDVPATIRTRRDGHRIQRRRAMPCVARSSSAGRRTAPLCPTDRDSRREECTSCTIVLATETGFNGFGNPIDEDVSGALQRAGDRVEQAIPFGSDSVRARQREDHEAIYDRVSLTLGDTGGAHHSGPTNELIGSQEHTAELATLLFHYGRYLLIASSRAGGAPANLQGIWNASPDPRGARTTR